MSAHRSARIALPVLVLALGCGKGFPETRSREVEQFRADLASPARFPIRHGLAIDVAAIQRALDHVAGAARAGLAARFADELRALPKRPSPAAPEFGPVVNLWAKDLAPISETMANEYVLDPNPERLALRSVLMVLPTQIAPSLGLADGRAAAWQGFLRMARPVACDCGHDDTEATICLDYGGLDVFVVTLATRGATWVPRAISWQERGRGDAAIE